MSPLKATVSGSFRKAMAQVQEAVYELVDLGVIVLSPADPRVVDAFGEFLFVASDRRRSIRSVQNRHLASIEMSDFLWLVCPDGYVGTSAAMEIGFAVAVGKPVFSKSAPNDLTLRSMVEVVPSIKSILTGRHSEESSLNMLIDPTSAAEVAHRRIDDLEAGLLHSPTSDLSLRSFADEVRTLMKRI